MSARAADSLGPLIQSVLPRTQSEIDAVLDRLTPQELRRLAAVAVSIQDMVDMFARQVSIFGRVVTRLEAFEANVQVAPTLMPAPSAPVSAPALAQAPEAAPAVHARELLELRILELMRGRNVLKPSRKRWTFAQLAEALDRSPTIVQNTVTRLVRQGYVRVVLTPFKDGKPRFYITRDKGALTWIAQRLSADRARRGVSRRKA